ncbi:hypothetical protein OIU78_027600 [Salix suchowensis]|nr:hypothetical protein OIU78_027600 [Salix suchowensis]
MSIITYKIFINVNYEFTYTNMGDKYSSFLQSRMEGVHLLVHGFCSFEPIKAQRPKALLDCCIHQAHEQAASAFFFFFIIIVPAPIIINYTSVYGQRN